MHQVLKQSAEAEIFLSNMSERRVSVIFNLF